HGGRGADGAQPYFGGRRNGVARTGPAAGGRDHTGLEQFHRQTGSFAERGGRAPRTRPPEEGEERHFPSLTKQKSRLAEAKQRNSWSKLPARPSHRPASPRRRVRSASADHGGQPSRNVSGNGDQVAPRVGPRVVARGQAQGGGQAGGDRGATAFWAAGQ